MSRLQTDPPQDLFRWADQLPGPLWDDVQARPASQAAEAVGATLRAGLFEIAMLGRIYLVDPNRHRIQWQDQPDHRVSYQTGVVLLTALAKSIGVPPSGRMITPQELQGGTLFFTGAHSLALAPLAERFGHDPQALIAMARTMNGEAIAGADCAVRLAGLPRLPLYVLLWQADEEFSARALIGIDDRALFHLDLAGVFALTNVMVARLIH